jgi:hypothetical protein
MIAAPEWATNLLDSSIRLPEMTTPFLDPKTASVARKAKVDRAGDVTAPKPPCCTLAPSLPILAVVVIDVHPIVFTARLVVFFHVMTATLSSSKPGLHSTQRSVGRQSSRHGELKQLSALHRSFAKRLLSDIMTRARANKDRWCFGCSFGW